MSSLSAALTYRRLLSDSATLRMLRADNLAIMAAVLGTHLGGPGIRLGTEDLHEALEGDLEELRDHFALGRRTAKAYCDDWRALGVLIRRPAGQTRGETYELSAAGFDAIRILDQLETPQTTLTESRLLSLSYALRTLAIDTDPDTTRKLRTLEAQRDQLNKEIDALKHGKVAPIEHRQATERTFDILSQAQALPADFARVRAQFEELNHDLRTNILSSEDAQTTVLDDIFRGVDLIESSDAGRTFTAFSTLIRDPERSAAFDEDVTAILGRDFAQNMGVSSRRALRRLMRDMKDGSRSVHTALTEFARGLRRYVQSQEFQRDRVLRTLLQEALAGAVPASEEVRPYEEIGLELELSSLPIRSVGELAPHDPADFDAGGTLGEQKPQTVPFALLQATTRETEIDFDELTDNVNGALDRSEQVTVGEILDLYPATQGVASVVGLVSLATKFGGTHPSRTEEITWEGTDKMMRKALIREYFFTNKVEI